MHFATAVDNPTVGLFGKANSQYWGPRGNGHVALRKGREADMISVDELYQMVPQIIQEHDEVQA